MLSKLGAAKYAADPAPDLLENVQWVSYQESADGGAADDDQFGRLNQDSEIAVLHQIARHYATENNDDADNRKHS